MALADSYSQSIIPEMYKRVFMDVVGKFIFYGSEKYKPLTKITTITEDKIIKLE